MFKAVTKGMGGATRGANTYRLWNWVKGPSAKQVRLQSEVWRRVSRTSLLIFLFSILLVQS